MPSSSHLEDNPIKQGNISRTIKECGAHKIDWVKNLEDGLNLLEKNRYDLIITDMNYPEYKGGCDAFSGEKLAIELEKRNIDIPVVMVSSCQYEMPEFIASIRSSDEKDWKTELKNLIRKIDKDLQSKKEEFYER